MPVRRTVSAMGGAACDTDDPPATSARLPMEHGCATQFGRGRQVDLHRAVPVRCPVSTFQRIGLENPGIVDQYVDLPVKPVQRRSPEPCGRLRIGKVAVRTAGGDKAHAFA